MGSFNIRPSTTVTPMPGYRTSSWRLTCGILDRAQVQELADLALAAQAVAGCLLDRVRD